MEGRAPDERDDGRGGHAPARVPRHPRRLHHGSLGYLDPLPAAPGRILGELPRRPGRAVHDDRGLRRAASRRRRPRRPAHAHRVRLRARGRRPRARACLHPHLARPVRRVAVAPGSRAPARVDAGARVGADLDLRLRVLGAPDGRRDVDRRSPCDPLAASRSRSTSSTARSRGGAHAARTRPPARSGSPTACSASTAAGRGGACARPGWRAPSAGSSGARRPTARGAASSRRGSIR